MINKLSGPGSMYYMKSDKFNMKVLLVGDVHFSFENMCKTSDKNAMEFHLYMDKYFKKSKEKIDYFIEEKLDDSFSKYLIPSSYLDTTVNYFLKKGCFSLEKDKIKKCREEYPNVKFHVADIRGKKFNKKTDIVYIEYILLLFKRKFLISNMDNDFFMKPENKKLYFELIKSINVLKDENKIIKYYENSFKNELVKKQLSKCSPAIRKKIKQFYMNKKHIIDKNDHRDILKLINLNYDILEIKNDKDFYKNISKIYNFSNKLYDLVHNKNIFDFVIDINYGIVDIYTLGRMFKETDKKNNIILHFGDAHLKNTIGFLRSMGFEMIKSIGMKHSDFNNEYERCLDISNFEFPFKMGPRQ